MNFKTLCISASIVASASSFAGFFSSTQSHHSYDFKVYKAFSLKTEKGKVLNFAPTERQSPIGNPDREVGDPADLNFPVSVQFKTPTGDDCDMSSDQMVQTYTNEVDVLLVMSDLIMSESNSLTEEHIEKLNGIPLCSRYLDKLLMISRMINEEDQVEEDSSGEVVASVSNTKLDYIKYYDKKKVKMNGKKVKASFMKMEFDKDQEVFFYLGKKLKTDSDDVPIDFISGVNLPASFTGQNIGISAKNESEYGEADDTVHSESCSYTEYRTSCPRNKDKDCTDIPETVYGSRDYWYTGTTEQTTTTVKLIEESSHDVIAEFSHTQYDEGYKQTGSCYSNDFGHRRGRDGRGRGHHRRGRHHN
jgi:hypothetical protein